MKFKEIQELEQQYVMPTYGRFPVALHHGKGATLFDAEGRRYIDFSSGIGVCSLGQADDGWVAAVSGQAARLGHVSNLYYTEPMAVLAKTLCGASGMDSVFFANSGAEANEGAIKLARKYSFDKYGRGRSKIITLKNSFHGRTITTLTATGQEQFHNYFFPFAQDFCYVQAGDFNALAHEMTEDTCAVMVEPIQGEGGVVPVDAGFVKEAALLCAGRDVLFMIDEVQTGIGRTGSLFCYQKYGVTPDVATAAKGLGGGLPIGAVLASEKCRGVLSSGTHGTTFGANPICCAGANAVLDRVLSPGFLESVTEKGEYIKKRAAALLKNVVDVRGMGLMIGIQVAEGAHKPLAKSMTENGVLVLTAGSNTLRLLPPLTITHEEIDRGLAIMARIMEEEDHGQQAS